MCYTSCVHVCKCATMCAAACKILHTAIAHMIFVNGCYAVCQLWYSMPGLYAMSAVAMVML